MKTKGSFKIKIIIPFAFLILICVFVGSHMFTNIYATGVDKDSETTIETEYNDKAILNLSKNYYYDDLFVFTKDDLGIFHKYNLYNINGNSVELNGASWEENKPYEYYVAVVNKNRDLNINDFDNMEAILNEDESKYILKDDSNNELELNKIIIKYVKIPPVIERITAKTNNNEDLLVEQKEDSTWETAWTNANSVKLSVTATDSGVGLPDNNYILFNGGSWNEFYDKQDVNISVKDKAENETTTTVKVNIDRTPPNIIALSNDGPSKVKIKVTDSESGIHYITSDFPAYKGTISYQLSEEEENTYIATVRVYSGQFCNQHIKFTIYDNAGNKVERTTNNKVYIDQQPPRIDNISFEKLSGTSDRNTTKLGDRIKVSFDIESNDDYDRESVKIQFNHYDFDIIPVYNEETNKFEYAFTIGYEIPEVYFIDNQDIAITYFNCIDSEGNEANDASTHSSSNPIKYYGPIVISDVEFKSNNSNNPLVARNNDRVYISFSANHLVDSNGSIIQDDNSDIEWSKRNIPNALTGKTEYEGYLEVENISSFDNQNFKFNFELTDSAGNDPVVINETYEGLEPVVYYAPLEDIIDLRITSDGTNPLYVKDGDSVSLYLEASHEVDVTNVSIAGTHTSMTPGRGRFEWTGSQTIDGSSLSDNSDIEFEITIEDEAGNRLVARTHHSSTRVKYYAPISISDLRMTTNNSINSVARNGNVVETAFKTSHPVRITQGKVADKDVVFQSTDGMNWKGYYTVANGDAADNEYISLLLKLDDDAGNEQLQVNQNYEGLQKIKYYAPINVYDVEIKSSNSIDRTKYAKNDDVITVTFKTNHDARITSANIAGKVCSQAKNDSTGIEKQWTLTYKINNGDLSDLSVVPFEFKVDDIAGNDLIIQKHSDGNVRNRITYYAPITETTSIASNYRNSDYAKNGDTITVSVRTNHDVSVTDSAIFNRAAINTSVNGRDLRISYTIPQNENGLVQGVVPFRYSLIDPAGNTLTINRATNITNIVTYDRTRPVVSITPEFNGFTNKNVSFTFNFTDDNLSANDVSIRVNGVEQISQAERANIGGKAFSKTITLSTENEYEVIATVLDKAGNKCAQDKGAKLTIDKTAPNITSTKIDLTKANSFKTGIKLIDLIDISEEYISEVICTLTDSEGTREYDINTPITGDGKKTINLTVKDMAGNVSSTMTFDFYIDGKPPKPVIKNADTKQQILSLDKKMTFKSSLKLMIGLDSFETSDTGELEKFVTLRIVDKNGKVIINIIDECTPLADGNYCVDIDDYGEYTLEVEAVDSVGNSTGLLKYSFELKEKGIVEKFISNKMLLIGSISAVVILVAVIIILVARKKRRYYI